jgi:hypothetical protein
MWANCLLKDFFLRENSVRPVRDFTARARYPSSLISSVASGVMWRWGTGFG